MSRVMVGLVAVLVLAGCTPAVPQDTAEPPQSSPPASPAAPPSTSAPAPTTPTAPETTPPAPTPPASEDPSRVELAITLADGKAEPNGERLDVALGTTVVITVTSDREDEVHVHGFDLEILVKPGKTVTKEFVADQTGSFEIESHEPEFLLVQLQVR